VPHNGDVAKARGQVMSVVQDVFRMPEAGPEVGSGEWIKWMSNRPKAITFCYAARFPVLLRKLVLFKIKTGLKKNGFPHKFEGEEVPNDKFYDSNRVRKRKGSNKAHKHLQFLNVSSVNATVLFLKNHGLFPVRVDAEGMPNGEDWDNFAEVLYTFWIVYCNQERLVKSSQVTRQVLLYLFYGFFEGPRGRKWSVVRQIHR